MPSQGFASGSSGTWNIPLGVNRVQVTAIGGGGSGFSDNDGDLCGEGGGGGGYARADFAVNPLNPGSVNYSIGVGGSVVTDGSRSGTNTTFTKSGSWSITGGGGQGGNQGRSGGGAGSTGQIGAADLRPGASGGNRDTFYQDGTDGSCGTPEITAARGGTGGAAGNSGGPCGYILDACFVSGFPSAFFQSRYGGKGGRGIGTGGAGTGCPSGRNGESWGGGGGGTGNGSNSTTGAGGPGRGRIEWFFAPPVINSFTAGDNFNTDGNPDANVSLSWNVAIASDIDILIGGVVVISNVQPVGSTTYNTGLQSVAGTNSPAEVTFTIRAVGFDGTTTVTATATSQVTNDNTPNNYFVPNLTDVEPNTVYSLIPRDSSTGNNVTGMDMNHFVSGGPGVEVSVNSGATWSTGSLLNSSGGTGGIRARVTSPDFNPDFTGQTNTSQQYSLTIGSVTRTFNITTRAPDVEETFNIPDYDDYVPNPDIDTIPDIDPQPENQSNLYIVSNTLTVDDIEIELPIRTDDPNVQVRIRKNGQSTFGNWQDITEIGT
jgi:hypothetical protein